MPYTLKDPPLWSKNKVDAIKRVMYARLTKNSKRSGSEQKARRASLAAMKLAGTS